jgi:hypothetical protein
MENRVAEILRSVDELLRRIERWLIDPHGKPTVPIEVELGIRLAMQTCEKGDVPDCCRDLAIVGVPRLAEEFRGYTQWELGKVRPETGGPGPGFWAAAKAVARARAGADSPLIEELEPVAVLLNQGVSHEQIARHIYGRQGVGPFLQPNGAANVALIEREAAEPGSVIPPQWIPPWHQEALNRRQQDLSRKLTAFERQELARKYEDPATVEELLRDGAFIQQVERAKGVTREDVLEAAARIGITPVDGPGYHRGYRESAGFDFDEEDARASAAADRQALRSLVIEMYTTPEGARSVSEIATELRKLGHDISTNSVSAMIGHWKRKVSKTTSSN